VSPPNPRTQRALAPELPAASANRRPIVLDEPEKYQAWYSRHRVSDSANL